MDAREAQETLSAGLAKAVVYLLEPNRDVAVGLRLALRNAGLTLARSFSIPSELLSQLHLNPPDVVILSENDEHNVFDLAKKLRQGEIGRNPFAILSLLISETKTASRDSAVRTGTDAIMIKPVVIDKIMDQITRLGRSRLPFIATTDYIGPERRTQGSRPSVIPLINVVNTLQYRLEGRTIASHVIDNAISKCMTQVWHSQLHSTVLKFHYISKTAAQHQADEAMLPKAKDLIDSFAAGLDFAAGIGRKLGKNMLSDVCQPLIARIAPLAANGGRLDAAGQKEMQDVTAAFAAAITALIPKTASGEAN